MGIAITDLLIELSDPRRYAEFQRNPEGFLAQRDGTEDLTAEDKEALLSRDLRKIRRHARSIESTDPTQQFNIYTKVELVVFEVTEGPLQTPEIHVEPPGTDNEAIHAKGGLYVDANGTFYRAVRES